LKRLSYNDFLFTAYWKIITAHVKSKKGSHCCACPVTDGLEVHHRTYENHGREIETWESDLNPFCGRCHSIFHTVTNKTIPNGDFVALERKSGRHPNRHPGRQRFNSDAEVMPA
jgi:5-methylcytosine-specific restriction endonuclease McrA